jgi:hypothetical protein
VAVVQQTAIVLPAATAGATPVPVALPTAAGIAPALLLPLPQTATSAQLIVLVSNVLPSSAPPFAFERFAAAARSAAALPSGAAVLLYSEIYLTATVSLPTAPGFTFTVPSTDLVAGANYYLSLYDPTRPSLGWQHRFEGAATIAGTTLVFAPNPAAFTFAGNLGYYFALIVLPQRAPQPTSAPVIGPVSIPTQPPPATPTPSPSPSSVQTAAPTPTPTQTPTNPGSIAIGITVPTPAPIVCLPASVVVAVGQTVPVGCSESHYGGVFQLVLADPAIATVTVPTPFPAPSTQPTSAPTSTPTPAPTPTPTAPGSTPTPASSPVPHVYPFSVTGIRVGTTTLSLTATDGGAGSLTITVNP